MVSAAVAEGTQSDEEKGQQEDEEYHQAMCAHTSFEHHRNILPKKVSGSFKLNALNCSCDHHQKIPPNLPLQREERFTFPFPI